MSQECSPQCNNLYASVVTDVYPSVCQCNSCMHDSVYIQLKECSPRNCNYTLICMAVYMS